MKIHTGDTIQVISGRDKAVTGKVISVDHKSDKLLVEGVNMVYRHVKPSQRNPQGRSFAQGNANPLMQGDGVVSKN